MKFADEDSETRAKMCWTAADVLFHKADKMVRSKKIVRGGHARRGCIYRAAYRLAARIHRIDRSQSFAGGAKYPGMVKLRKHWREDVDAICGEETPDVTAARKVLAEAKKAYDNGRGNAAQDIMWEAAEEYTRLVGMRYARPEGVRR